MHVSRVAMSQHLHTPLESLKRWALDPVYYNHHQFFSPCKRAQLSWPEVRYLKKTWNPFVRRTVWSNLCPREFIHASTFIYFLFLLWVEGNRRLCHSFSAPAKQKTEWRHAQGFPEAIKKCWHSLVLSRSRTFVQNNVTLTRYARLPETYKLAWSGKLLCFSCSCSVEVTVLDCWHRKHELISLEARHYKRIYCAISTHQCTLMNPRRSKFLEPYTMTCLILVWWFCD